MVKLLRMIAWEDINLHETPEETFMRKVAEGDPWYVKLHELSKDTAPGEEA